MNNGIVGIYGLTYLRVLPDLLSGTLLPAAVPSPSFIPHSESSNTSLVDVVHRV